jgi:hypothetical protein
MKFVLSLLMFVVAMAAGATPVRSAGCAETAEAAVAHLLTDGVAGNRAQGFRVDAIHVDAIHHREWAMVASCDEPAKPLVALPLPDTLAVKTEVRRTALAVRTGDRVVVMSPAGDSRMQLVGSAMESGVVGQRVRVRLELVMDGQVKPTIACEVMRAGVVEVVR